MSPISLRGDGQDSVGKFTIMVPGWCHHCEVQKGIASGAQDAAIQYKWPEEVVKFFEDKGFSHEVTILKDPEHSLGISCGCYAKFTRQITHIDYKRKSKPTGKKRAKTKEAD